MKVKNVKWIKHKEIASTNDYAKEKRGDKRDLIVTAKRQTGGRGTKGRSFSSNVGGVYLTSLRFYENFPAKHAFKKMASATVAVCKTLEAFGVKPVIKWSNDIHVNGKKICGILTENTFLGEWLTCSVIGIGVNVCNALPAELEGIATTLERETGKRLSVRKVTKRLIKNLAEEYPVEEYLKRLGYMGRQVELILGDERVPATLLRVDNDGGLWVEIDGKTKRFTAAEVSIKL
jgi:BirA family biotin operon repressor/biotin-[acetyl-CoA-carboxylase] ligase